MAESGIALRLWLRTCASSCVLCGGLEARSQRPSSSTAGPCARPPESGARAAYDSARRKKGSKLHLAVDTLGHHLALHVDARQRV